jgi:glucose/arabinose dehydrogenase
MLSKYGLIPVVFLMVSLSGCSEAAPGTTVQRTSPRANPSQRPVNDRPLPEPYATESSRNRSEVIERPDGAQLHLPEGFQIREYTPDFTFQRPRFMVLGPSNEVLVSDSHDEGSVYVLQDTNQDGVADSRRTLIEGMYRPYGIDFWQDYVYVAGTTAIKRWKYDPSSMTVSGQGETVVSWPEFEKGHWTRTLAFNQAGTKMFVSIGSASNVNAGEDPRRAAINVYNPDGTGHELYAQGLRNAVGMDFYPDTQELWVTVQERDALGDDLVPDYFSAVHEGEFFGWPYAYIGPHEDPRRQGEKPELVEITRYPDVLFPAHCGMLDIEFYTGSSFPEKYQGGAFLACHGSWNRSQRIGYRVDFVPFKEGQPTSGPEEFLSGWMLDPGKTEVWGRPVGILQLPDGSLLISDDGGKKIWRVSYGG